MFTGLGGSGMQRMGLPGLAVGGHGDPFWARHVLSTPWWYGDRRTFNFMVRDYKPRVFYFEIVLPLPADSDLQPLFMV